MMNNDIGVLIFYKKEVDILERFKLAKSMGINSCQLSIWDESMYSDEYADIIKDAVAQTGFKITAIWAGWDGPREWNFTYGPSTIGLVPPTYRNARLNALKKASEICEITGCASLADDSGLEVTCLSGAPGVYSARYSGEPCDNARNRAFLLENMNGAEDRSARFVSCIVLYKPGGEVVTATGYVEGYILEKEEGDNGFGYDCLFYSNDLGKSFGVASDEEKNSVSHRGRALRALLEKL